MAEKVGLTVIQKLEGLGINQVSGVRRREQPKMVLRFLACTTER